MEKRFFIYRSRKAQRYLCVCLAVDAAHAVKIAKRLFNLDWTAYAVPEVL